MAKIRAGILSKVQGKVGGVVGATWKGKNYLREHVKPSNPNTPAQQLQRSKMSVAVKAAGHFLGGVLTRFVNPFVKSMSAYNWFVKQNIAEKDALVSDINDFNIAFGNLAMPTFDDIEEANIGSSDSSFAGVYAPAARAGTSIVIVAAVAKKDGSLGAYSVTEALNTSRIPEIVIPITDAVDGDYFMSIFCAEVQDLDGANEKVLRCSNTQTVSRTV